MITEEILYYMYSFTDKEYRCLRIDAYFIQDITFYKYNIQNMPCEDVILNTLFINQVKIEPEGLKN